MTFLQVNFINLGKFVKDRWKIFYLTLNIEKNNKIDILIL